MGLKNLSKKYIFMCWRVGKSNLLAAVSTEKKYQQKTKPSKYVKYSYIASQKLTYQIHIFVIYNFATLTMHLTHSFFKGLVLILVSNVSSVIHKMFERLKVVVWELKNIGPTFKYGGGAFMVTCCFVSSGTDGFHKTGGMMKTAYLPSHFSTLP